MEEKYKLINFSDCIIREYNKSKTQQFELDRDRLVPLFFLFMSVTYYEKIYDYLKREDFVDFEASDLGPCIKNVYSAYPAGKLTKLIDEPSLDELDKMRYLHWGYEKNSSDLQIIKDDIKKILQMTSHTKTSDMIKIMKNYTLLHSENGECEDSQSFPLYAMNRMYYSWEFGSLFEKLSEYNKQMIESGNQIVSDELQEMFDFAQVALDKKLNKSDNSMEK